MFLYITTVFRDGPYLNKAKKLLNLNDMTSMRQRPGESFPAARKTLVGCRAVSKLAEPI